MASPAGASTKKAIKPTSSRAVCMNRFLFIDKVSEHMILVVAKKIKNRLHCREKNIITSHWDGLPAEEQTIKFTSNQVATSVLARAPIILLLA